MQLPVLSNQPLETLVSGYSATSIFRTIGFIGDSLLSGEIELIEPDGSHSYHDFMNIHGAIILLGKMVSRPMYLHAAA